MESGNKGSLGRLECSSTDAAAWKGLGDCGELWDRPTPEGRRQRSLSISTDKADFQFIPEAL